MNMQRYAHHRLPLPLRSEEIAQDKRYRNIAEVCIGGDHYKWRAMRTNGIDEDAITGNASDKEKFSNGQ